MVKTRGGEPSAAKFLESTSPTERAQAEGWMPSSSFRRPPKQGHSRLRFVRTFYLVRSPIHTAHLQSSCEFPDLERRPEAMGLAEHSSASDADDGRLTRIHDAMQDFCRRYRFRLYEQQGVCMHVAKRAMSDAGKLNRIPLVSCRLDLRATEVSQRGRAGAAVTRLLGI